jgi:hypothetical protein
LPTSTFDTLENAAEKLTLNAKARVRERIEAEQDGMSISPSIELKY